MLFAVFTSPPPETWARLVTDGTAAEPTETTRSKLVLAAAARLPGNVAVTTCPTAPTVQPVPLPDTKLRPAGSVSVTKTVSTVAASPTLVTVIV